MSEYVDRDDLLHAARRAVDAEYTESEHRAQFADQFREFAEVLCVPLGRQGAEGLVDNIADHEACARFVLSKDGLVARLDALAQERAERAALYARAASYLSGVIDALLEEQREAHAAAIRQAAEACQAAATAAAEATAEYR